MVLELERLENIIFQLLLSTESRTTDFLELIVGDHLYPVVTEQRMVGTPSSDGRSIILRESCLLTEKNNHMISQNIALIYPESIPLELYSRLLQKKEGIGKVMKTLEIESNRNIIDTGYRSGCEIVNLFGESCSLLFGEVERLAYKEYTIHFSGYPHTGIHLLEYFNPGMLLIDPLSMNTNIPKGGHHIYEQG
jgi:hypothetical protein